MPIAYSRLLVSSVTSNSTPIMVNPGYYFDSIDTVYPVYTSNRYLNQLSFDMTLQQPPPRDAERVPRMVIREPVPDPIAEEARRQADRNRKAAQHRAQELLFSFLTEAQRIEYQENKSFTVVCKRGVYRIKYGRIANIEVLRPNSDRVQHRLCVHPKDLDLPVEDIMVSQLLHLRNNEAELLARANVHHV